MPTILRVRDEMIAKTTHISTEHILSFLFVFIEFSLCCIAYTSQHLGDMLILVWSIQDSYLSLQIQDGRVGSG